MNRSLLPIFLIVAVDILGLTIVIPLLPFYAEKFGASPLIVGCLITSYAVCQLISGPILGNISDHVGRKPLLLVSQVGTFIGFIILGQARTLPLIFLSRVLDGCTAGNITLAQAYISDVTEPKDRSKAFGIIGISFGLGFLIGPAISGYLSQFGYHYPIYAAAGLSLLSILATMFFLPADTHSRSKPDASRKLSIFQFGIYATYLKRPALSPYLFQFFLFAMSFSVFLGGFALFSERRFDFGPPEVGYVFAFTGLLGIFIQGGLLGRLVKRYGDWKLIVFGFFAATIGYFLLGLAFTIETLLVSATITSFGNGVLRPCLTSIISQRASRNEQGIVLGLTQSMNSIAQIVAPLLSGLLIEVKWLIPWAFLASLLTLGGLIVAFREKEENLVLAPAVGESK